jgi:ribonuclease-3
VNKPGTTPVQHRPIVDETAAQLQELLNYAFADADLLEEALTHASARGRDRFTNERLEYLGDAVLDLVISDHLFEALPEATEGEMTHARSLLVSRRALARVGRALGLEKYLRVDEGIQQREPYPTSILAGVYEALVAALYLDGGMAPARAFILRTLGVELERIGAGMPQPNSKSRLQEEAQAAGRGIPGYRVVRTEGPDHERRFLVAVNIGGRDLGEGWGRTKKEAEQNAARLALEGDWRDALRREQDGPQPAPDEVRDEPEATE